MFTVVLSESLPLDIDRILVLLEAKQFTVEQSTIQSLQQLMQWVADLALNILAKLPDSRGNRTSGVSNFMCISHMSRRDFLLRTYNLFFSSMI